MQNEPMFPILNDPIISRIPWAAIAPHEKQAQRNHSQTLRGLAGRGGLSVHEAYHIMKDQEWPNGFKRSAVNDARSQPVSVAPNPEAVYFQFVHGDAFGVDKQRLRIRKWDTKPFDGGNEYRLTPSPQPRAMGIFERRYTALCDWYLRGAPRSEIHKHGHIERTTQAHIDAWADAAASAPMATVSTSPVTAEGDKP